MPATALVVAMLLMLTMPATALVMAMMLVIMLAFVVV